MKNIFKKFAVIAVLGFVAASCGDESFDIKDGGRLLATVSPDPATSYFFGITTSVEVDLNKFENPGATISKVTATKVLSTQLGDSDPVTFEVAGTSFSQTTAELLADVPIAGNVLSDTDLSPGDTWTFTYQITLTDGTVLNPGGVTVVTFTCLSDLSGTYNGVSGGLSTDGCPPTNPLSGLNYEVTLTETSAGEYDISDFSVGVYQDWYGACYGYTFETSAPIVDICGILSMSVTDGFSCAVVGSGTVNADGTLTISWSNCFGDTGNFVLTKK